MKKTMVTCRLCKAGIRIKNTKEVDPVTLPGERVCRDMEACMNRRKIREQESRDRSAYAGPYGIGYSDGIL